MTGYFCGQEDLVLPARDYPVRPAENVCRFFFYIINLLFAKRIRSRWLASFLLRVFMDIDSVLTHQQAKKKIETKKLELCQYPTI